MKRPNFFIVGAPKCGTTAMHEYLAMHPDIFMPTYKEPHFFGSDLRGPRFKRFRNQEDKYLRLYRDATHEKRLGESSVWYLSSQKAAEEIKAWDADARIIIMLRSPVEMLHSLYYQFRFTGNETMPTFKQALDIEAARREGRDIPKLSHTIHGLFYRNIASFTEQVKRYQETFGPEQVHVIVHDDMKADVYDVYRKVLVFLGVDETFETDLSVINANREVRMGVFQKMLMGAGISPLLLKDAFNEWTATSRFFPPALRQALLAGTMKAYTRHEKRPPMDAAVRRQLQHEFMPEVERLSALLDRDLTHWCRDDSMN